MKQSFQNVPQWSLFHAGPVLKCWWKSVCGFFPDRQSGRQRDEQTDRQTDRQTHQQRWRYNLCRFMGVIMIFFEFLATETIKNITQNVISCIKLVYFNLLSLFWHRYGQCIFHLMNGTMTFYLKVFIRSRIPVVSRTLIGWIVSTHLRKKKNNYVRTDGQIDRKMHTRTHTVGLRI